MLKQKRFHGLFAALGLLVGMMVLYALVLHPAMERSGATAAEATRGYSGDAYVTGETVQMTMGVDIQAAPLTVWSWLIQLGQDRAGFYSYDFLEGMVPPCEIHNADRIVPEWQSRAVGDIVHPCKVAGGWYVESAVQAKELILNDRNGWSLSFYLEPQGGNATRLVSRMRYIAGNTAAAKTLDFFTFEWIHAVMQKGILLGIRQRAEGRLVVPSAVEGTIWWAAFMLFLSSFIALFFKRDWRGPLLSILAAIFILIFLVWVRPPVWIGILLDLAAAGLACRLVFFRARTARETLFQERQIA